MELGPGGGPQRLRLRLGAQHEYRCLVLVLELLAAQLPHVQAEARGQKGLQPTELGRERGVQRGARGVGGVGERGERGAEEVVAGELVNEKVLRTQCACGADTRRVQCTCRARAQHT